MNHTQQEYTAPTLDFETWSQEKLTIIKDLINQKIQESPKPVVVVLEIGHFMLPCSDENLDWAFKNVTFANLLAAKIVRKYKKEVKLLPTLLINNLDSTQEDESQKTLEKIFEGKKFLPLKAVKLLSERNLKNRSYKALKKNTVLANSFIHIDGKAYLKDEEYQHDLAAGFMDEEGNIVPRCGLILTSFLDKVSEFTKARMYPQQEYEVVFVSFSQEYHEYERVKLGVDIYTSTHQDITVSPLVMHWNYSINQCHIAYRTSQEKRWQDVDA